MPVRIYDIAKKLGLPNKVVLEKARELGITAARAASCSLDKITAEFLEQQFPKPELIEPKPKKKKTSTGTAATAATAATKKKTKEKEKSASEAAAAADKASPAKSSPAKPSAEAKPVEKETAPKSAPKSSIKEVEDFVLQDLEELSAGKETAQSAPAKPSKTSKRETVEKQPQSSAGQKAASPPVTEEKPKEKASIKKQ